MRLGRILFAALALIAIVPAARAQVVIDNVDTATEYSYFPALAQIGVSQKIQAEANYGTGILVGVVDTGINFNNQDLVGHISNASSCVATSFTCPNGAADDSGHGSVVAGIIAASLNGKGMVGVAPGATIVAEKALDSTGSGQYSDVANGITAAANAGAKVINVSVSWENDPSLIASINYAASKGAVVVYAGGNGPQAFNLNNLTGFQNNITGLTAVALTHLVFVGSVSSSNALSFFSNTPGTGLAVSGTNGPSVPYKNLWVMAPGENLLGPDMNGTDLYDYASGTSVATAMVSGDLTLLLARWPILVTRGTATDLLFTTATNLGPRGVDTIFGNGEADVATAFAPVGTLALPVGMGGGHAVVLSAIGGGFSADGALGSLTQLSVALGGLQGFDALQRNYPVNLSGLVTPKFNSPILALATPMGDTTNESFSLADGASLATTMTDWSSGANYGRPHFDGAPPARIPGLPQGRVWQTSLTEANGQTMTSGYGFPPAAAFTGALWGSDEIVSAEANGLGISNSLLGIAEGGPFAASGLRLSPSERLGFAFARTAPADTFDLGMSQPSATAAAAGYTVRLSSDWSLGLMTTVLGEQQGLLGTTYTGNASLGQDHSSAGLGMTLAHRFGNGFTLTLDTGWARADAADLDNNLITHVSPVQAWGAGASLARANVLADGDRLSFGLRKPLQVYSGSANLIVGSAAPVTGVPVYSSQRVGLAPEASEADATLGYSMPLGERASWNALIEDRENADGVRGNREDLMKLGFSLAF